jgi:hypothetical protein
MLVLIEIDVGASFSQVSLPYPFNGVMVVLVKIYGGGMAAGLQRAKMGMILLMAARVSPSLYWLFKVGFVFWVTPAPYMAFNSLQILFGLKKWSRRRVLWVYGDDRTTNR